MIVRISRTLMPPCIASLGTHSMRFFANRTQNEYEYSIDDDDADEFTAEELLGNAPRDRTMESPGNTRASKCESEFPIAAEHADFLSLLDSIAVDNRQTSILKMKHPSIPSRTFGIALPPKWAAEVPRRLSQQRFMSGDGVLDGEISISLSSRKIYLFQQAFIHPSYVRVDDAEKEKSKEGNPNSRTNVALRFTNYPLAILGHSLLRTAVLHWAVGQNSACSAGVLNELIGVGEKNNARTFSPLLTDEALARIASLHWSIDDLLLCDGKMYESMIAKQKKAHAMGSSTVSGLQRPVTHTATIVPSLCAAVYLAHGMDVAMRFIETHVLPLLITETRGMLVADGTAMEDSD